MSDLTSVPLLHEIALATGGSLELRENCRRFLKTLIARTDVDVGSVWVRGELLPEERDRHRLVLAGCHPESGAPDRSLRLDHPIARAVEDGGVFSAGVDHPRFAALSVEPGTREKGAVAIFPLGGVGVLELHSLSRNGRFGTGELAELSEVARRFAVTVEACLSHERLRWETSRRDRAEGALRAVVEGTASLSGERLYRALVRSVASVFRTDHAFLVERIGGNHVRTLAHWHGGFLDNAELDVTGTPCERVLAGRPHREPEGLRERYPDSSLLALWNAESFVGMPVLGSSGRVLGCIAVIGAEPLRDDEPRMSILETFAVRVRAELERVEAVKALGRSEDRYRELYEDNPSMYFTLDGEGTVVSVNEFGARQLGYTVDELLGRTVTDVFHPEDRREVQQQLARSIAQPGRVLRWRFRKTHRDGSLVWVEEFARTVQRADGKTRTLIVCQDITDRIRAEEERHRLETKVQQAQKLESLGVLAGGVAHDFNNLLAVILGNADLSLADIPMQSRARTNIEEVKVAAKRAAELCQQMLTYAGQGQLCPEPLDLNALVGEMANLLKVSVSKKAALDIVPATGLPAIGADAIQVRQVIMNLITNASEALENEPGTIHIATGVQECDSSYLGRCFVSDGCAEGEYVYLDVIDDGVGMDRETSRRIFDPFFTTKFSGRGLGLAAVMGIMHGHRGAIAVETERGNGTRMRVLFPSLGHPAAPALATTVDGDVWRTSGVVLLADDEEMVRRMGRTMLETVGLTVLTAADGREAVELFRGDPEGIRCVLLDATMPGLDGEEALTEIHEIRGDVPVVISSGYEKRAVVGRFDGHRVSGFVHKPYTAETLFEVVRRALEPARSTSARASSPRAGSP